MVFKSAFLHSLVLALCVLRGIYAGNVTSLAGTWTTKSATVLTGPGFYNPVEELFTEPTLPGLSFSFTDDGHYEEAFYYVVSNPTTPSCATALLQFQHGTYEIASNGSIILRPIAVDGRQLLSDPCTAEKSVYSRYSQFEVYSAWEIIIDEYRGQYRLNLNKFDGSVVNPLYLVNRPPAMLPTITLNPTALESGTEPTLISNSKRRMKRDFSTSNIAPIGADHIQLWWWVGFTMMVGGGSAFIFLQRDRLKGRY
ncbi:chaperone for protein-folding within the ER, fungal-domain-containing protein [Dipodascopsis uninucleata]